MSTFLISLTVVVAAVYAVGFAVCLPNAYRWCKEGYDYGVQNNLYNGSAALGFALFWPLYLYLKHRYTDPPTDSS
jgi:hypothetical protein